MAGTLRKPPDPSRGLGAAPVVGKYSGGRRPAPARLFVEAYSGLTFPRRFPAREHFTSTAKAFAHGVLWNRRPRARETNARADTMPREVRSMLLTGRCRMQGPPGHMNLFSHGARIGS